MNNATNMQELHSRKKKAKPFACFWFLHFDRHKSWKVSPGEGKYHVSGPFVFNAPGRPVYASEQGGQLSPAANVKKQGLTS